MFVAVNGKWKLRHSSYQLLRTANNKVAQGFSKAVKTTDVAAISNPALSSSAGARLGNRGYIRDFGKVLKLHELRGFTRAVLCYTLK